MPPPSSSAQHLADASDFELACRLYQALLDAEERADEAWIADLLRQALNCTEVCLVLPDRFATIDEPWRALLAEAEIHGTLVRNATPPGEPPQTLGLPLIHDGEMLAFLGAARPGSGFDACGIRRLDGLGTLLAGLLQARRTQQQRLTALAAAESDVRRKTQMLDQINDSIITMDPQGYITGWNRGAEKLFGYTASEIIGDNILRLYADEAEDDSLFNAFLDNGSHEITVRRRKKSGEIFWASVSLSIIYDEDGGACGLIGYLADITSKLAAEEKLRLHAHILEHNSEAVLVTDAEEQIVSCNQAFRNMTGFSESQIVGRSPGFLFTPGIAALLDPHQAFPHDPQHHWSGELVFRRRDGNTFPAWATISQVHDDAGQTSHYFVVFSDLSERKEAERQIYRLAYYDLLTGLPNRALLYTLLEQAISEAHRKRGHGALLFLDLNRFKNINDSFGHTPADTILREVGLRLQKSLRDEDIIARLGGDEFVVALFDTKRREDASFVARKLLNTLSEPFFIAHHEVLLSASIGISIYPEDGRDTETLLKNADLAMHRAKALGSSAHVYYSREMNQRTFDQLKLEGGLRRGIERDEFFLHYQPQLDLASGRISGAEALLRWQHPEHGLIPPAHFIPVAEETGLIVPIGEWVVDAACAQIREWMDRGLPAIRIAVNLSARQFSATLPQTILAIVDWHQVPHDALELEITESMLMHNAEAVVAMMREFANAGIKMALDDFGTGYSSLSYLKRFPIDSLKIDQSFVRGIPGDADDSAITRAIISMAKNLRLSVIAEGVETEEQLDFLREAACEEIQGYHFSRPLPADEFAALLLRTNR